MLRVLLAAMVLVGCASDEPEGSDADDLDDPGKQDGAVAGQVRVVQMNPYYAGRLAPYTETANSCARTSECAVSGRMACTASSPDGCFECIDQRCRARNFDTAEHAADLFSAIQADVIGIQELAPEFAGRLDTILEQATGVAWEFRASEQGVGGKGSGVGAYWRTDRIELAADLGPVDVGTLPSGYIVRFHGVMLRPVGTQQLFGFYSGKLDWNSDGNARREAQAQALRAFIDRTMAGHAGAKARIVASDFNDIVGSDAYDVFADYDDGDARKPTSPAATPSRRIDYLFWADGTGGASSNGFTTARSDGRLGRSEYYGSDHRFIYGDARIP